MPPQFSGEPFWTDVKWTHRVVAHLYYSLPANASDHDENLAWSIASRLKGVGYLSDYDPLADPAVQDELKRLRTSG